MVLSFFRDSVTVKRAPIITKNGAEKRDWANHTTHVINGVQVVPQTTARDFDDRTTQATERRTLRAGFEADIESGDRIIWKEQEYEIDGEVFHTVSPSGRVSSTRCTLVRWEG